MSSVLSDMVAGVPEREKLARDLRFTVLLRAVPTAINAWDLRGPAVFGVGSESAAYTLRRWALGAGCTWHCVVVNGVGEPVDQITYDGCGQQLETPYQMVASACMALAQYPIGYDLRERLTRELKPILNGWAQFTTDEEGRLCDE